jgi:glycosyltransferase involved in cell wall biosynthesis
MTRSDQTSVALIAPSPPSDETGQIPIKMDTSVLVQFHQSVQILTRANVSLDINHPDVKIHKFNKPFADSVAPLRILGFLIYQLKFALAIASARDDIGIVLFRGTGQVAPMAAAKLVRMTVFLRMAGVLHESKSNDTITDATLRRLLWLMHSSMCWMTDRVVVTSPYVVTFAGLEPFESKVHRWQHYFFDLEKFSIHRAYSDRDMVIGHVGTLDEIKGSTNFAEAMCNLSNRTDISVLIVGDGEKRAEMETILEGCGADYEMRGQVNRDKIPEELNKMKLLAITSKTEGVPKVLIEALACGTPVVATEVGGIPDYVEDGKNGFLIKDNAPDVIAKQVLEAFDADLEEMSAAARESVQDEFTYRNSLEGYYELLESTRYKPGAIPEQPSPPFKVTDN